MVWSLIHKDHLVSKEIEGLQTVTKGAEAIGADGLGQEVVGVVRKVLLGQAELRNLTMLQKGTQCEVVDLCGVKLA